MRAFAASYCFYAFAVIAFAASPKSEKLEKPDKNAPPAPVAPKTGLKSPGVQIPAALLKYEYQFPVGAPMGLFAGDSIYAPDKKDNSVARVDPKTHKALDALKGFDQPCGSALTAFGSLWATSCASHALLRYDVKGAKLVATIEAGATEAAQGMAATADSIWLLTDSRTMLSRIDPMTNAVVGELRLPPGCTSVTFGEMSLWVTCPSDNRILRIDPATNLVTKRIEVSASPRSVAFGDGSVWVLCEKEGKVERIDPKTNKVIKTLELQVPNAGGNIAFGDGSLWVTQAGFPLTRIDTKSEKEVVMQQFWGEGSGFIATAPGAVWLTDTVKGTVTQYDPKRVTATLAE